MTPREKCEAILSWAEDVPTFDTKFVMSVMSYIDEHGDATFNQLRAIDNIIDRFNIDVDEY